MCIRDSFVTADRESSEWVPTESGAPSLQSSSDLRFLCTTRPWRGVKDFAIAVMSSTFGVLKPDSTGFEERSLVKWELRSMPWFVVFLSSLGYFSFLPPPVGGVAFRLTSQHEHSKQAP